ncbi:MAG: hypothetical protein AAB393_18475 [Bacteroidota bacterium]
MSSRTKRFAKDIALIVVAIIAIATIAFLVVNKESGSKDDASNPAASASESVSAEDSTNKWLKRAKAIDLLFHYVYTPCWEGANGAIGDAYLFAATHDSALLRFHLIEHEMRKMCVGTWVDDRAWVGLAEYYWWKFTGKANMALMQDASLRYDEARREGRLSNHEGYWTWYNWPRGAAVNERIFTNSNMNQMVTLACCLYEATGDRRFLNDALLVWNGDGKTPGIEKTLYKGNGRWEGRPGRAAFGKELPWGGTEYCTIGAAMYRVTKDPKYREIVVATAKLMTDPATGWIDPADYFQIHMDGNGNFVHYLMDAYEIAPNELADIPGKVERMLEHVWTNHYGTAAVTLHRESDHGIRNGWNPFGGEDGYGVDEVGTVHAQSQAVRAFGVYAWVVNSYKTN